MVIGNFSPQGFFVFLLIDFGPELPSLPPKLFIPITKNLFVSRGLFGPIRLSHHPGYLSLEEYFPAKW